MVSIIKERRIPRCVYATENQVGANLQGVEVGLKSGLLLDPGGLVVASVESVLLEFLLEVCERVVRLSRRQPGQSALDPFKQVGGEALVLLHEALVLLVNLEHLADAVGSHLGLRGGDDVLRVKANKDKLTTLKK